jgi:hypothetical protein
MILSVKLCQVVYMDVAHHVAKVNNIKETYDRCMRALIYTPTELE